MLHLSCEQGTRLWQLLRNYPDRLSATQVSPALKLGGSYQGLIKKRRSRGEWEKQLNVPAINHGNKFEALSISKAREILEGVFPGALWKNPGIVPDPWGPFCCSPDAVFFFEDRMFGLEVKTPYSRPLPRSIGDLQMEHIVQCFVCLMVTKARRWFLFYYSVKEARGVLFSMDPDPGLWLDIILPEVEGFLKGEEREDRIERKKLKEILRSKVKMLLR